MDAIEVGNRAVDRALRLCAESSADAAAQAAASLAVLLKGIENSARQEVKWNFSRLTGDGFPIEFTFSSASEAIIYAAEFAAPEVPHARRLQIANKLLQRLGSNSLSPELTEELQKNQQSGALLYGAWLSGRHNAAGNSYKIYLEIPQDNLAGGVFAQNFIKDYTPLAQSNAQLRMFGYNSGTQSAELYFRTGNLETWNINSVMSCFGLAAERKDLVEFVGQIFERTFRNDFLPSNAGLSIAFSADRTPVAISLFAFARSVFRGGDDAIRRALLRWGERLDWKLRNYEKVSAPLAARSGWHTLHGMVVFSISRGNAPTLQIGLRPPD